jgi:CRP-like cAMP-binding protein
MTRADFEGLAANDVEALRRFSTRRTHPAGTQLIRQGDRPKEVLIVERGVLELLRETTSERLIVQILHAGASVDDIAAVLDLPYSESAVTVTEATVLHCRLDTIAALEECSVTAQRQHDGGGKAQ